MTQRSKKGTLERSHGTQTTESSLIPVISGKASKNAGPITEARSRGSMILGVLVVRFCASTQVGVASNAQVTTAALNCDTHARLSIKRRFRRSGTLPVKGTASRDQICDVVDVGVKANQRFCEFGCSPSSADVSRSIPQLALCS